MVFSGSLPKSSKLTLGCDAQPPIKEDNKEAPGDIVSDFKGTPEDKVSDFKGATNLISSPEMDGVAAIFDNDTEIFFSWSAGSDSKYGIRDYTLHQFESADCSGLSIDKTEISGTALPFVGKDGKTYSFKITAYNGDGIGILSDCSTHITIDITAPTVGIDALPNIDNSNKTMVPVSGTCSENGGTITIGGAVLAGTICLSGVWSQSIDYSAIDDGTVLITADLTDAAGNAATQATGKLTKDTVNPTFTVTYNGNGNTSGSVPTDSTNPESEQTVTILGNSGSLVKTNYTFTGWNTLANGTGTTYTQGQILIMPSTNITLYAKWTANPVYTVTYYGNGSGGGSVPTDSSNYYTGQTVTVLGNSENLVKNGYTFVGWNTLARP